MKNNIFAKMFVFSFLFFLIFSSCRKDQIENYPVDPVTIDITADQVSLIGSENTFAFDIFKKVLENAGDNENIIISPLSVALALSMTLNGATGTTRDAMLEALRVKGITPDIINNSYKDLSEALLNVDKRVLISIANSVWIEKNFVVKKQFTDILTRYYNAESKSFDISDAQAPKQINTWIESKTNGLIKNMIERLNDNTVMLLINAIYFKGKWKFQFDAKNTVNKLFYKPVGTVSAVPMMKQKADFKSYTGTGFILAEFPYGQGNFVMDIILPDDNDGVKKIISSISSNSFRGWLDQLATKETEVTFPRFKYGYKKQLKDVLTIMGMGISFTDKADFSNISNVPLLINDVTHQAFIETNEDGTEAAAVTIVDIGVTSIPISPFVVNIDHPFIYIIRETTTNSILFMGRVADPLVN
jgi:serine protease inhibitor